MKNMPWNGLAVVALLPLILILPGCSNSTQHLPPTLVEVTGTVTLDGSPLSGASVAFQLEGEGPANEKGAASGTTDSSGKYSLNYTPEAAGAVPGSYKVLISKMADVEAAGEETVPAKYNRQTELKAVVKESGPNNFDFDLKSK